ncbi:MAG: hypothetical protein RBT01_03255 [Anaerolineaceae bacterium]|nr:hypothetical protein [Anaerolineaceae bacterium]
MRFFWFFLTILFGLLIGFYFGWVRTPTSIGTTQLSNLRSDYLADYVLMAAESYEQHQNLAYTTSQLVLLGDQHPLRYIQKAIIIAEKLDFSRKDLEKLAMLAQVYQIPETATEAP